MRRLQADFDDLRETFSGHGYVKVDPVGSGRPPESYRVTYRLRGLALNGEQPDYRDLHELEIMLPRHYPAEKPYVVPLTPIFHPNVRDYYCIADYWAAGTTLSDVIVKLGDMIQWRIYNIASPLDAIAAKWAAENERTGLFPIGRVDLGVADVEITLKRASGSSSGDGQASFGELPSLPTVSTADRSTAAPEEPDHIAAELLDSEFVVTLRSH